MITICTAAYNEELLIQLMISHYRTRFPNCEIIVFDNMSTDNTVLIAKNNNCTIIPYNSNNKFQDSILSDIKNNWWKKYAKTDWVLVCDVDEMLNITEKELINEESAGTTVIKTEAFNMINLEDNYNMFGITHGVRYPPYDKKCLFNKKFIKNMNYDIGAHNCKPEGLYIESIKPYHLYHYKYVNTNYTIARYAMCASRLSHTNLANHWGMHYLIPVEQIHAEYAYHRTYAIKLF